VGERLKPAVLKNKIADLLSGRNSTESLCQPQDSDEFSLLEFVDFCLFCASYSDNLVTLEGFNLSRT
jgi:hypothetical protein